MSESNTQSQIPASDSGAAIVARALTSKMDRSRAIKNKITSFSMAVGGIGVIMAIVLIFFYLAYVVYPLFLDRKSTRLNSSHLGISYAVFFLKKKKK